MPLCCRLTVLRSRSVLVGPEGCFERFVVSHTRVLGSQEWSGVSEAQAPGPCRPASVTASWPCDLDCCLLGSGRGYTETLCKALSIHGLTVTMTWQLFFLVFQ